MTNTIQIRSGSAGFDSRLFFPSTLNIVPHGAGLDGNGPFYTGGSVNYRIGSVEYREQFTGEAFGYNAGNDVHGRATSGTVAKYVGGSYQTIGTMAVFPDPDNFYEAAIVNSAAWMTPDNLLLALSQQGGAKLYFIGSSGADKFFGSNSADSLRGGQGLDQLTGYGGADEFFFRETGSTNYDHITDFSATDTIKLDRAVFKTLPVGVLKASAFKDITNTAKDADDRILYNHDTGYIYYDTDGSGSAKPVVFAVLDNHYAAAYHDFVVY